jgi:hypothetical protein
MAGRHADAGIPARFSSRWSAHDGFKPNLKHKNAAVNTAAFAMGPPGLEPGTY